MADYSSPEDVETAERHWETLRERWQSLGIMIMCHGTGQPISAQPPEINNIPLSQRINIHLLWKCQSQLGNNNTSSVCNDLLIRTRLLIAFFYKWDQFNWEPSWWQGDINEGSEISISGLSDGCQHSVSLEIQKCNPSSTLGNPNSVNLHIQI